MDLFSNFIATHGPPRLVALLNAQSFLEMLEINTLYGNLTHN
jgi:hypothetical protein